MDLTGWLDYFIEGLAIQMDEVKERGERVIKADVLTAKHRLNPCQKTALWFLCVRLATRSDAELDVSMKVQWDAISPKKIL